MVFDRGQFNLPPLGTVAVGQAFRNALRNFLLHRRHRFVAVDPGQVGAQLRQPAQLALLAPADESLEQLTILTFAKHPLQGGVFSAQAGRCRNGAVRRRVEL
ncbi:hypothetical protein AYM39_19105 [Methylomonas sp. DH-1]|nr:hypothetical protein AYM39_19105 [Methylomonas sp. DH-1]